MTDELLSVVREAAAGSYHVYGELGREGSDDIWYLGKDLGTEKLVALRLRRIGSLTGGQPDYDLEVAQELDAQVSVGQAQCQFCGAQLRRWARFCTQCGKDLSTGNPSSPGSRAALLAEVKAAAAGIYDVLGEMPWAGGAGVVYFAVEKATQRLVRLRLNESMELGETRVMMPLTERLTAQYVTRDHRRVERSRDAIPRPEFDAEEKARIEEAKRGVGAPATPAPPQPGSGRSGGRKAPRIGAAWNNVTVLRVAVVALLVAALVLLLTRG